MRKLVIILALAAASLTGYSQALPANSVPFGQQVWIAPDGSIWVGKDGNGYKQVITPDGAVFTGRVEAPSFTATGVSVAPGINLIGGSNNSGGLVGISGNETKFVGFIQNQNRFTIGYGTVTSGTHQERFSLDLPTGNAEFSGTVGGDDAISAQDFVTLSQLQDSVNSGAPKTFYVFDGLLDNQTDTTLLEIPLQGDGYWDGSVDDKGWRIEFEFRGSFANSGIDNELNLWIGPSSASYVNIWAKTILQGSIPAQEFWISGTITKLGATLIRREIDFKTGDSGGVDSHSISTTTINGIGEWNLETGPDVQLELSTNFTSPGSVVLSHARFTRFPLNGTYDTNF